MRTNADQSAIEVACFHDLGRLRQDELPLNDKPKHGRSTFTPSIRNGADRIPSSKKEKLNAKWNTPIQDEESEQMKGLVLDNARPYAKNAAKQFLEHFAVDRTGQQDKPSNQLQPLSNTSQPGRKAHAGAYSVVAKPHSPAQQMATSWSEKKQQGNQMAAQTEALPEHHATPAETLAIHRGSDRASSGAQGKIVIYHGFIQIVPDKIEKDGFITKFDISVLEMTEQQAKGRGQAQQQAFLTVADITGGERRFIVSDFEEPRIEGNYCVLKLRSSTPPPLYVRFGNPEDTQEFCICLQFFIGTSLSFSNQKPGQLTAPVATTDARNRTELPPGGNTLTSQAESDLNPFFSMQDFLAVPNDIKEALEFKELDFPQTVALLLQVVEYLFQAMEKKILNSDGLLSEELYKGIEDGVLEVWKEKGLLARFDEDLKQHLILTIHHLVLLKAKIDGALKKGLINPLVPEPAPIKVIQPTNTRIQYSMKDMEHLRGVAALTPGELKAVEDFSQLSRAGSSNKFQSKQVKQPAAASTQKPTGQGIKSAENGLGHKNQQVVDETPELDHDFDTPMGNTEYALPASVTGGSSQVPQQTAKGLGTSSWAATEASTSRESASQGN